MPVFHCSSVISNTSSPATAPAMLAKASMRPKRSSVFLTTTSAAGCHQVEFEHERFGADRFDLLANLSQFLFAAGRKDDGPEVASQTKCRGLSDTRACAGNDRDRV